AMRSAAMLAWLLPARLFQSWCLRDSWGIDYKVRLSDGAEWTSAVRESLSTWVPGDAVPQLLRKTTAARTIEPYKSLLSLVALEYPVQVAGMISAGNVARSITHTLSNRVTAGALADADVANRLDIDSVSTIVRPARKQALHRIAPTVFED